MHNPIRGCSLPSRSAHITSTHQVLAKQASEIARSMVERCWWHRSFHASTLYTPSNLKQCLAPACKPASLCVHMRHGAPRFAACWPLLSHLSHRSHNAAQVPACCHGHHVSQPAQILSCSAVSGDDLLSQPGASRPLRVTAGQCGQQPEVTTRVTASLAARGDDGDEHAVVAVAAHGADEGALAVRVHGDVGGKGAGHDGVPLLAAGGSAVACIFGREDCCSLSVGRNSMTTRQCVCHGKRAATQRRSSMLWLPAHPWASALSCSHAR